MTEDQEAVGQAIDRLMSLHFSLAMPLPAELHVKAMRDALAEIVPALTQGFIKMTGENPWE